MEILIQIMLFLVLVLGTSILIYFVFYYRGGIVKRFVEGGFDPDDVFNEFGRSDLGPISPVDIKYTDDVLSGKDAELIYGHGQQVCEKKFNRGWWGTIYFEGRSSNQLMEAGNEWETPENTDAQTCYGKTTETDCTDNCEWYKPKASIIQPFCGPPPLECKKSCQNILPNPGGGTQIPDPNTEYEFSNKGKNLTLSDPDAKPSITGDGGTCTNNGNLGFIKEGGKWVPKCACVNLVY